MAASPAGIPFVLTATMLRPTSTATTAFAPAVATGVETTSVVPRLSQVLGVGSRSGLARLVAGIVFALSLVVLGVAARIGRKRGGERRR